MTQTSPQPLNTPPLFKPPSAIIYTNLHEPICHIPMTDELYEYFTKYEIVRFPIQSPVSFESTQEQVVPLKLVHAEISAMRVYSSDGIRLILIARNEEIALLMRSTFLPGQTKELNFIKTHAFYQGMIQAIKQIKNK